MTVLEAKEGVSGFDCNQILSPAQAKAFYAEGFRFCIRYLPRTAALSAGNVTKAEIETITGAGLAMFFVQHCALPNWLPSADLGKAYGEEAVTYAKAQEIPIGVNIWLDLEMVEKGVAPQAVIDYCNQWYESLQAGGYVPGIYIGYQTGLTPENLYNDLKFQHYWRAYNGDDVCVRGFQVIQDNQSTLNGVPFDPNTIQKDKLGGLPIWLAP